MREGRVKEPEAAADQETADCPFCGKPVAYKWVPGGGFVSEPHNVLLADSVLHAACFEASVAEWDGEGRLSDPMEDFDADR